MDDVALARPTREITPLDYGITIYRLFSMAQEDPVRQLAGPGLLDPYSGPPGLPSLSPGQTTKYRRRTSPVHVELNRPQRAHTFFYLWQRPRQSR